MKGQVSSDELRRSLLARRQKETVQLRKHRREERLQARRLQGSMVNESTSTKSNAAVSATAGSVATRAVAAASSSFSISSSVESDRLSLPLAKAIETYISSSGEFQYLELIQQQLLTCTEQQTTLTLEPLARDQPDKAKTFISLLSQTFKRTNFKNNNDEANTDPDSQGKSVISIAYNILLAITSTSSPSSSPSSFSRRNQERTSTTPSTQDNYYGWVPLTWSDMILEDPTLVPRLLSSVPHVTVVSNILGNLLQQAGSSAVNQFWPAWTTIVDNLPATSYLCAAMVQKDVTSLASSFLQYLTTHKLALLLLLLHHQQPAAATTTSTISATTSENNMADSSFLLVDLAWILEGISRREDSAVRQMCQDETLLQALATLMAEQTATQNVAFLFPAVKALGNMAVACDGLCVPVLVSHFSDTLRQILEKGILLESVKTASCLLFDAGLPGHPSTLVALPSFAPSLIRMVVLGTLDWKREAAVALELALADPPFYWTRINSGAFKEEEQLQNRTDRIWEAIPENKHIFLLALLDVSTLPDMVASLSAIRVLDRFLRRIPGSPQALAECHHEDVVDRLHAILAVGSNDPNYSDVNDRAEIALDLLDDFFEKTEDDQEDDDVDLSVPLTESLEVRGGTFAFGVPPEPLQQSQPPLLQERPPPSSRGRGRGRLLPAWMTQQQQQQQSL